jgi:cysteine synthase A
LPSAPPSAALSPHTTMHAHRRCARATARGLHTTAPRPRIYNNILETIGDTPVVRINALAPAHVTIYAKCEYFNPLSSVKDRLALAIIETAEANGTLKPGDTVVEATSGNTGIALSMVCAQKGYPCVITMAETFSVERRKVMRALGSKVVLTPAAERGTGMVKKAQELAAKHGWFLARQFENDANPTYHANTTGPEIVKDFAGQKLDYWVTGYGTGGTLAGAGKIIKAARPDTKIIVSEPEIAGLLTSGEPQKRQSDDSPAESHPAFTPHPIQGWTPDFIPKITEDAVAAGVPDEIVLVKGEEAIETSLKLASMEGLFTGISGGASMAAALKVADAAPEGSVILTMLPDTAERYLSTPLFAEIGADMNDEETEISQSTPGQHMPEA